MFTLSINTNESKSFFNKIWFIFLFRSEEPKILDYQTQQYKLFPVLAFSYAAWFAKEDIQKFFDRIYQNEISKGDFKNVGEVVAQK